MRSASAPNSSRFGTVTEPPKRPSATWLRNPWNSRTGRMKDHEMTNPAIRASATTTTAKMASAARSAPELRDAGAQARHPGVLGGDERADERLDLLVDRLLPGPHRRHRVRDPPVADGVRDVGDGRHRVVLRAANGLDQRALVGPRRRLEPRERVVEAVVLAQDQAHRVVACASSAMDVKCICMASACSIWRDHPTRA